MGQATRTEPVQWEMTPAGWIKAQFDQQQHQEVVMQQESTDFIVMTMNLRFGLAQDRMNRWELRKSMVSRILETYPADFLRFQEVNHFQAEHLCRVLKEHNHIGWHSKNVSWWQCNMIFYHNSWTCLEQNHYFLSRTPGMESKLPGSKWPRQCVVGRFQKQGVELIVVNTHFDFKPGVQKESADLVMGFLSRFPGKIGCIVTGDFNANPGSPAYERFMVNGFHEVFAGRSVSTFHEFQGKETGKHIDWILFRGGFVNTFKEVITDAFNGRYPSDHFPVRAGFSFFSVPPGKGDGEEGGQ